MKKFIVITTAVLLVRCAGELPPGVCAPLDEPLRAGQTIDVGRIHVTNDAENIYVGYETKGGWVMNKTHVNFSETLDGVPRSGGGAPVNGKFTFQAAHSPAVTQFGYEYLRAKISGTKVVIMTHAEVERNGQGETAYGGSQTFPGTNRWAYYTEYTICEVKTARVEGTTFFDIDKNGARSADEPILPAITVSLQDASGQTRTTVSDDKGKYLFSDVAFGGHALTAQASTGLKGSSREINVAGGMVVDLPLNLQYTDFCALSANGFTIGYWKNNIGKALEGTTKGVQVDGATLQTLVERAAQMALEPLSDLNLINARDRMSANSPRPVDLLIKQLVASELNLANDAVTTPVASIGSLLVYEAEFMLKYPASFLDADMLNTKDWLDAYNNTHGGNFVHAACP